MDRYKMGWIWGLALLIIAGTLPSGNAAQADDPSNGTLPSGNEAQADVTPGGRPIDDPSNAQEDVAKVGRPIDDQAKLSNGQICGYDPQCCYTNTRLQFDFKSPTQGITIVTNRIMIVQRTADICLNCIENEVKDVCTGMGMFNVINNGMPMAATRFTMCGNGFLPAKVLMNTTKSNLTCSFKKGDKRTTGVKPFTVYIHTSECPLPPYLVGAMMEGYISDGKTTSVNYKCKKDNSIVTKTCNGKTWSEQECPGPVVCEDWDESLCPKWRDLCDKELYVREHCMKTCGQCAETTTWLIHPRGAESTTKTYDMRGAKSSATSARLQDLADRTSSIALSMILPLITNAWI